ncbi:MAG: chemotaxis protein CheW [Geitlerinemataceae cyanobacterium]
MASVDYFKVRVSADASVALPLSHVQTVMQIDPQLVCPIPGLDASLLGTVNREGELTWVLDLSHFLGLGFVLHPPGQRMAAIALAASDGKASGQGAIACIVTALEGVFSPLHVQPIDRKLKPRLRELLKQIAYHDRTGIAILEPDRLFEMICERGWTTETAVASTARRGSRLS